MRLIIFAMIIIEMMVDGSPVPPISPFMQSQRHGQTTIFACCAASSGGIEITALPPACFRLSPRQWKMACHVAQPSSSSSADVANRKPAQKQANYQSTLNTKSEHVLDDQLSLFARYHRDPLESVSVEDDFIPLPLINPHKVKTSPPLDAAKYLELAEKGIVNPMASVPFKFTVLNGKGLVEQVDSHSAPVSELQDTVSLSRIPQFELEYVDHASHARQPEIKVLNHKSPVVKLQSKLDNADVSDISFSATSSHGKELLQPEMQAPQMNKDEFKSTSTSSDIHETDSNSSFPAQVSNMNAYLHQRASVDNTEDEEEHFEKEGEITGHQRTASQDDILHPSSSTSPPTDILDADFDHHYPYVNRAREMPASAKDPVHYDPFTVDELHDDLGLSSIGLTSRDEDALATHFPLSQLSYLNARMQEGASQDHDDVSQIGNMDESELNIPQSFHHDVSHPDAESDKAHLAATDSNPDHGNGLLRTDNPDASVRDVPIQHGAGGSSPGQQLAESLALSKSSNAASRIGGADANQEVAPLLGISKAVCGIMLTYHTLVSYLNQTGEVDASLGLASLFQDNPIAVSPLGTPYAWENARFDKSMQIVNRILRKQQQEGAELTNEVVQRLVKMELKQLFDAHVSLDMSPDAYWHQLDDRKPVSSLTLPLIRGSVAVKQLQMRQCLTCSHQLIQRYREDLISVLGQARFSVWRYRSHPGDFARRFLAEVDTRLEVLETRFPELKDVRDDTKPKGLDTACLIFQGMVDEVVSVVSLHGATARSEPKDRRGRMTALAALFGDLDFTQVAAKLATAVHKNPAQVLNALNMTLGRPSHDPWMSVFDLPAEVTRRDAMDLMSASLLETVISATVPIAVLVHGNTGEQAAAFLFTFVAHMLGSLAREEGVLDWMKRAVSTSNARDVDLAKATKKVDRV